MLFGGMMVGKADISRLIGRFQSFGNFIYSAKLSARYLVDRVKYPRGTRLMMGNALVAPLFYSLRKRKVPVMFDAAVVDLTGDRHGVNGAWLNIGGREIWLKPEGRRACDRRLRAQQGYRATFMPQPVPEYSMSYEGNQGDGVDIGRRLGASITPEQCTSGLWTPVSSCRGRTVAKACSRISC